MADGPREEALRDLRGYLDFVRRHSPRQYLLVEEELSPDYEVAALVTRLGRSWRTPVIEVARVRGSRFPLVTNVCASLPLVARAAGWEPRELEERLAAAYDHLRPPVPWGGPATAPVRENVLTGEGVDLGLLPRCRYTESETRPYLTAAAVVARDPAGGAFNVSYHRLMLLDRRRTAIFMGRGGHLWRIFSAHAERGEATPVAVAIGLHPLWSLGALAAGPPELDELEVVGGLVGRPLEVVEGLADPRLRLPARCEIALEGRIRPDATVEEGPFGEFAGYATRKGREPVLEVEVMSFSGGARFQDIVAGTAEHLTMTGVALSAYLRRTFAARFPWVRDLHLPAPMTVLVAVERTPGTDVPALLREVLLANLYVKHVFCFDAGVPLTHPASVLGALAAGVRADRDLTLLPGRPGTGLDPSEMAGKTAKLGVDATAGPGEAAGAPEGPEPGALEGDLKQRFPALRRAWVPAPGVALLQVASPAGVPELLRATLRRGPVRFACAVDTDVRPGKLPEVLWAVATRCQADRDLVTLEEDPTCWGLDATATPDLAHYAPRNRLPPEVLERMDPRRFLGR